MRKIQVFIKSMKTTELPTFSQSCKFDRRLGKISKIKNDEKIHQLKK